MGLALPGGIQWAISVVTPSIVPSSVWWAMLSCMRSNEIVSMMPDLLFVCESLQARIGLRLNRMRPTGCTALEVLHGQVFSSRCRLFPDSLTDRAKGVKMLAS